MTTASPLSRIKLICMSVPAMVMAAWAAEGTGKLSPGEVDRMEAEYLQEQNLIELQLLKFQVPCLEGTATAAECQSHIEEWVRRERGRLVAQSGRAGILDSITPLENPVSAPPGRSPLNPEEAELQQVEVSIAAAIQSLRRTSADPFEAQVKIDRWAHDGTGAGLLLRQEELRAGINAARWRNLTSIELEEPENATPAELAVLDIEEKIAGKWLALKMSVPDGDLLKLQDLVARSEGFFEPLREELAKAQDVVRLERMRQRISELEAGTGIR